MIVAFRRLPGLMAICFAAAITCIGNDAKNQDLFQAIRDGYVSRISNLLAGGADPSARDSHNATPLMYAAQYSTAGCMELLLKNGAHPNDANSFGATALMWGARDADKVRLLLANGADVTARAKSGRTALMAAAAYPGARDVVQMMIVAGADVKVTDPFGSGALTAAAESGDTAVLKILLDKGADPNEKGAIFGSALMKAAALENAGAVKMLVDRGATVNWQSPQLPPVKSGQQELGELTALLMAVPMGNPAIVKTLLDAGADLTVRDMRGMSALSLAVAAEKQNAEVVRLLLKKGADVNAPGNDGRSALDWARLWGETPIVALLRSAGAKESAKEKEDSAERAAVGPRAAKEQRQPREAVEASLRLLQVSGSQFFDKSGCGSCHHQYLTNAVATLARDRGLTVDDKLAALSLKQTITISEPLREMLLQRNRAPGAPTTTAALANALADQNMPQSPLTDALVHDISGWQRPDGSWHSVLNRPPLNSDFTDTAFALRTLCTFAPKGRKAEIEKQIDRGRAWMLAALPQTTHEHVMRMLGLSWSGVQPSALAKLGEELTKLQREDGGWAQRADFASDAYATGQALYALHTAAGVPVKDDRYRRGVQFLLRTQLEDGSWYVKSRSVKFQPYFDSAFPHGHDQWISSAATAWAARALVLSCDQASTKTSLAKGF